MSDTQLSQDLFASLNESQAQAVRHTDGPLLVLAGAGAGKTRVITYRIAYLIKKCNVMPHEIMAVTFTNKAAAEMKSRVVSLVGPQAQKVWMGTFHSIGLNMLRRFSSYTPVGDGFSIMDQDDRLRLVKNIIKECSIDSKKYSAKNYLSLISDYKNTLMYVEQKQPGDIFHRFEDVFNKYEQSLRAQHAVDFDDMLSLPLRMLLNSPDVLEYYRSRCKYILVDEYQDTNTVQFMFLQALAGESGNICVVGDDDQAIYGWRGAEVENILYFDAHFKGVKEVKLTENYRSAPEILTLANNVIGHNTARRGKELVPFSNRKGDIAIIKTVDEVAEAEYTATSINKLLELGVPESEIAILYRTNAQSRNFEVVLNRMKIPYKVIGGVGFYQRREIKDILSYLRLFDNPYDEAAFTRAAKTPPKGIGDGLVDKVRAYVSENESDYISAANSLMAVLPVRQASALGIIDNIMNNLVGITTISEMINYIIEAVEYRQYLIHTEDEAEAKARTENLAELYNAAVSFEEQYPEGTLTDFLATATLVTSGDSAAGDAVSLMSLHGAKGLEFEAVFLTGLEDGIFPLSSHDEPDDLEEERRLCYVGITRAKTYLKISNATSRMVHGKRQLMKASRFLNEMGAVTGKKTNPAQQTDLFGGMHKGQAVFHDIFGTGIVMQVDGSGDSAKVDVLFKKHGMKKLVARFLKTTPDNG